MRTTRTRGLIVGVGKTKPAIAGGVMQQQVLSRVGRADCHPPLLHRQHGIAATAATVSGAIVVVTV
eukprot:4886157-Karenia_brevis.AAC.1